jgi:hypothetical protein
MFVHFGFENEFFVNAFLLGLPLLFDVAHFALQMLLLAHLPGFQLALNLFG